MKKLELQAHYKRKPELSVFASFWLKNKNISREKGDFEKDSISLHSKFGKKPDGRSLGQASS
jgi:hypothetical protein